MSEAQDEKLAEFLVEAKHITEENNFGGMPNKSMFWGHTKDELPHFSRERNNFLCALYQNQADPQTYKLDSLDVIDPINFYFDRLAGSYPPEILDQAWEIFSDAFAQSAKGEHVFIAANDMRRGDFFETVEFPVIRQKFKFVTTLEPAINGEMFAFKKTEWSFNDWFEVQKNQWDNPYHYLDGNKYPNCLMPHR
jgi:hypothetical protein